LHDIFPTANTIVCIEESKLLKQFRYDILYETNGLEGALSELNDINYFHSYKNADRFNYGNMLDDLMESVFDLLEEIAPSPIVWKLFALYYDIHNMKLVVKERFFARRLDSMALRYGSYSLRTIRSAAVRQEDNILGNELLTAGFFEALHCKDIYEIEFILDRTYFKVLRYYAEQLAVEEIVEFVKVRVDLYNISAYFQGIASGDAKSYLDLTFSDQGNYLREEWKKLWQEYEHLWIVKEDEKDSWKRSRYNLDSNRSIRGVKSEQKSTNQDIISLDDFVTIDVIFDNYLIHLSKRGKLEAFGYMPICAYFFNKLIEIKNIRILLTGKERGSKIEDIKMRMRIPYEI